MSARTSRRPRGLLTTLALAIALVAVQATWAVASRNSWADAEFVDLINQSRASAGVATVSTDSDMTTVARLHDAFMDSSAHRNNILDGSFDQVGVGVEILDDQLWVTVYFREHDGTGAATTAPGPEPEPEPTIETETEPVPEGTRPVDPTTTRTYLLLRRVELLESATGLVG